MTAPNLLVAAGLACARPTDSQGRDAAPARPRLGEAVTWLARRRAASLVVFGGSAAGVLAVQTVSAWAASVLNRAFGLPSPQAALVFGAVWIPAAVVGHLGGGWMLDTLAARRRPPTDLLAGALLICGASVAASAFAPSWVLCAAAFAAAAAAGSTAALSGLVAMQTLAPDPLRGPLGALFLAATSLVGFGVGPLVTGVLSDLGGTAPATLGTALATCVGPTCLAGALLCLAGRGVFQRLADKPPAPLPVG